MTPSQILFNNNIPDKKKFGTYCKARRTELGMTDRELALSLKLSPSYIADIENSNRPAPLKHIEEFANILRVDDGERIYFYDIAGSSHGNWPDINDYLAKNPNAREFIRLAKSKNLSGEDILNLVTNYEKELKIKNSKTKDSLTRC